MTKKQIRILIITLIIVILIVLVVYLLTNTKEEVGNAPLEVEPVNNNLKVEEKDSEIIKETIIEKSEEDVSKMKLKSVAKNFTERYGTWSTDNRENNFKSTKVYTTSRMENIIEDFVLNEEKLVDNYSDYYGITTKALNVKIIDSSGSNANLIVSTQQIETLGDVSEPKISYKTLNLELVKFNSEWLVDYAKWE